MASVYEILRKHGTARQGTDDNMVHEHCMLDNYGYRHTLRICNNFCFSAATMVARRRLNVRFICA